MSHQRYPSLEAAKEPHSISLKVLRLSRPSLVTQHPTDPPPSSSFPSSSDPASSSSLPQQAKQPPIPASLAYASESDTNPSPFLLSPILNLPVSFGSAYVGETFSCTLCANNDLPASGEGPGGGVKAIRDVRIEAEMKTPGSTGSSSGGGGGSNSGTGGPPPQKLDMLGAGTRDLAGGETLQGVVGFDLKEEGNHVLAVTVSYYEASETSGRTRTFRKLYQFICKSSLVVRTKVGVLDDDGGDGGDGGDEQRKTRRPPRRPRRRWVLEAQLENCSDGAMQLDKVVMDTEAGLTARACNWEASGSQRPVLHPGEVEQVCFLVDEEAKAEGRIVFGVLGIGWRGEMGNRGFLSTGKLGTKGAR
ncbi:hypothetical protein N3K66_003647 [Trichothecium roseum]|uniref:Uncharacterized protein n=1 Tax=Trichothecium roseum TaxID=47278 RepID=A0ACC0V624_9HYPO|nr:hypothetical protein N3K66_003647 [Trichothecium roseum]